MKVAIIGIPRSGKTTIFNALTRGKAEVAAYSPTLAPNAGVAKVSWANAFHRNDIGWRAIAREG